MMSSWLNPVRFPYGGTHRGAEAVMAAVVDIYVTYYSFSSYDMHYIVGDSVNAVAHMSVTVTARCTGKQFSFTAAECFGVRDGKILSIRPHHFDTVEVAEAFTVK